MLPAGQTNSPSVMYEKVTFYISWLFGIEHVNKCGTMIEKYESSSQIGTPSSGRQNRKCAGHCGQEHQHACKSARERHAARASGELGVLKAAEPVTKVSRKQHKAQSLEIKLTAAS